MTLTQLKEILNTCSGDGGVELLVNIADRAAVFKLSEVQVAGDKIRIASEEYPETLINIGFDEWDNFLYGTEEGR